jgi:hypothetical protein
MVLDEEVVVIVSRVRNGPNFDTIEIVTKPAGTVIIEGGVTRSVQKVRERINRLHHQVQMSTAASSSKDKNPFVHGRRSIVDRLCDHCGNDDTVDCLLRSDSTCHYGGGLLCTMYSHS